MAETSISAAQTFALSVLDRAVNIAKTTSPLIRPLKVGNQSYYAGQEIITKLGPLIKLPEGVMISSDNDLSKALNGANDNGFEDSNSDSGVEGARYSAVRFMTDGTCRRVDSYNRGAQQKFAALSFMSLPESFLTVVEDDGKRYTGSGADAPKNFYTIQIDPYTGKSRSYRPGF